MDPKLLENILRFAFFGLAAWGAWRIIAALTGEGDVTFGTIIFVLIALCVTGLYLFFGVKFNDVLPEGKRIIEAALIVSLVLSFSATTSTSTELDSTRAYSGLRLSKLIVDSLMAVVFYGFLIIVVEQVSKMRREAKESSEHPTVPPVV